jgi:hypothetical protein
VFNNHTIHKGFDSSDLGSLEESSSKKGNKPVFSHEKQRVENA